MLDTAGSSKVWNGASTDNLAGDRVGLLSVSVDSVPMDIHVLVPAPETVPVVSLEGPSPIAESSSLPVSLSSHSSASAVGVSETRCSSTSNVDHEFAITIAKKLHALYTSCRAFTSTQSGSSGGSTKHRLSLAHYEKLQHIMMKTYKFINGTPPDGKRLTIKLVLTEFSKIGTSTATVKAVGDRDKRALVDIVPNEVLTEVFSTSSADGECIGDKNIGDENLEGSDEVNDVVTL